jgi:DNA modification methylase
MSSTVTLHNQDWLDLAPSIEDCSIDAVVTDPPAGIGFMGKAWDNPLSDTFPTRGRRGTDKDTDAVRKFGNDIEPDLKSPRARRAFVAFMTEAMQECYRVLKPGGYAVVWALPRTSHWTACAVEDAGFEIRDVITHLFGSGFPKSKDVSKEIDRQAGAQRTKTIGVRHRNVKPFDDSNGWNSNNTTGDHTYTAPATPEAQQWQGWGTALKPANEHWIIARKPLSEPNVAQNVLRHGTGAINIDACRVRGVPPSVPQPLGGTGLVYGFANGEGRNGEMSQPHPEGRWPSNLVLTHSADCNGQCAPDCPVRIIDEQSGPRAGMKRGVLRRGQTTGTSIGGYGVYGESAPQEVVAVSSDEGGASRFFPRFEWDAELDAPFLYTPKPSRSERNAGCEGMLAKPTLIGAEGHKINPMTGREVVDIPRQNHHPTVKPVALMRWLVRLVTPPGGTVLDPFCGSGTTGVACVDEGFSFVGCDSDAEYFPIAEARTTHAQNRVRQLEFTA